MNRCKWCGNDPLYITYHDDEWGIPVHDDRLLFEFLILEGAQAGLSWLTILKKRENYRKAFHSFDYETIANYPAAAIERLLSDPGIVRNRLKIEASIDNARAFLYTDMQWIAPGSPGSRVPADRGSFEINLSGIPVDELGR